MKNFISELICTRISHDLIGNIGATSNAVELMEDGDMDILEDVKNILKTSSFNLLARMKFFRLTFGLDNKNLEDIPLVKQIANDYLSSLGSDTSSITLDFSIETPSYIKSALTLLMICADLIIRDGSIKIFNQSNQIFATVSKQQRLSIDKIAKIDAIINGNTDYIDANSAPLAFLIEKHGNKSIKIFDNEDNYCINLTME